jgi:hypothetical protein
MIGQLGSPTFFVTFNSAKNEWLPLLQCLYDFNSKKLGFNMPFDKLEMKHIVDLIQSNHITCVHYYDHAQLFIISIFRPLWKKHKFLNQYHLEIYPLNWKKLV